MPTTTAPPPTPVAVPPVIDLPELTVLLGTREPDAPCQWLDGLDAIESWCPVLGPTSSLLMSKLVRAGERTWPVEELAHSFGVSESVLRKSLMRLRMFKLAMFVNESTVVVAVSSPLPRPR